MNILTKNQEDIVLKAIDWYYNSSDLVFQISGNPGTGKSFILHEIVKRLDIDPILVAPMAYTGAAAIVMRCKGFHNAKTIHSWLLKPVEEIKRDKNGEIKYNDYFGIPETGISFVPKDIGMLKLFVIDEGMMVPKVMREIIEKKGIKTIVAGDVDQLPPVKYEPAYLVTGKVHYLTEIFRQNAGSGIIYLSQRIKHGLPVHMGWYGDCNVIYDDEVTNQMILQSDVLICGRNETRQYLTDLVRKDILRYGDGLPLHGERLVCRNNNWNLEIDGINLANGLVGEVHNDPDVTKLKRDTFRLDFKPLLLNVPFKDIEVDYNYFKADFKDKYKMKFNRYAKGEKLEYAYAITTHISQGSEYANGMVFEEFLNPNINRQLHYTGITRFRNFCIYVKHRKKYY